MSDTEEDQVDNDRDYFAEGADACLAGRGDIPPADVPPEHEGDWIDGWHSIASEKDVE